MQGNLIVRSNTDDLPYFEVKWRQAGRQIKKRLPGWAWLERDAHGEWIAKSGKPSAGHLNRAMAVVVASQVQQDHEAATITQQPHLPFEVVPVLDRHRRCKVDGCFAKRWAHGYCNKHWQRVLRHGDPSIVLNSYPPHRFPKNHKPVTCIKQGCTKPEHTQGLCGSHWHEEREWGERGRPQRYETCPVCRQRRYTIALGYEACHYCRRLASKRKGHWIDSRWDRGSCLMAGYVWYQETGWAPSSTDWAVKPDDRFPCSDTIRMRFGTWRRFTDELGVPVRIARCQTSWPVFGVHDCVAAGVSFVESHGYFPVKVRWEEAGMTPGLTTVCRRMGSWSAFKLAVDEAIKQRRRRRPRSGILRPLRNMSAWSGS